MRGSNVIVVKLGGSHAGSGHLAGWLRALATCGGRVVVVPGGGAFADTVRAAQIRIGFDDTAAHAMALLAMEQFGLALTSLEPRFRMAASIAAIRQVLRDGDVPVWAPTAMVLRAVDIPASWDITSDSLAAWLAGRMKAKHLLMVKYGALPGPSVKADQLAARGVVDPVFPWFLAACGAQGLIATPAAHGTVAAVIRTGGEPGVRIDVQKQPSTRLEAMPWPRSKRRAGAGP